MIPKLILAPMAAVNCASFRLLCKKYGADLVYTQMFYVDKIIESKNLKQLLNIQTQDHPIAIQLIGALKDEWEKATKLIEPYADIIDINFGCPEPEALEKRSGSYLLNQKEQMKSIVKKVISSTSKPVTAKIRSGWAKNEAIELATMLESEGVSAIALHPRVKKQKYTGKSDWKTISDVKKAVQIPIYGNGDIEIPGHAKAMFETTKCDGIMIARAVTKNPALFQEIKTLFETGKKNNQKVTKTTLIKDFIKIYEKTEIKQNIHQIQDHCCWLASDLANSKEIKEQIRASKTTEGILNVTKFLP